MGFFGTLLGSDQAKAAKRAASVQARGEEKNRTLAKGYTATNLKDLDRALAGALGEYDTGQAGATNALTSALDPYAKAGTNALSTLLNAMGLGGAKGNANALARFQTGPGYQFQMDQGVEALDRSATARGGLYSGAAGKALTGFGQGLANQEWGNWLDRLTGVTSSGQAAAGTIGTGVGNILSQFAGSRADALLGTASAKVGARTNGLTALTGANSNKAAATASGIVGAANARSNALSNLLGLAGTLGGAFLGQAAYAEAGVRAI